MENAELVSMVESLNESLRSLLLVIAKSKKPLSHLQIRSIFNLTKTKTILQLQPLVMGRFIAITGTRGKETVALHPEIDRQQLIDLLQYSRQE